MKKFMLLPILILSSFAFQSQALVTEGVDNPDTITINGKQLVLNGAGLRTADRFGLTFKVYVIALYLEKKSSDATEILNSKGTRYVKISFLRRVAGKDVAEPIGSGTMENCKALIDPTKCEDVKKLLLPYYDKMPEIMDKGTIEYTYQDDRVDYLVKGRKEHKGTITGSDAVKSLMGMTLGPKPVSEKIKAALLGTPK